MFDSRIHLRFDLDHPPGRVPQHFTNIHAGLRLARSVLSRQPAANKQIIVITDGEPTAHIEGREVVLIYPPAEKTATHTLAEVSNCANAGIRVSSFALIEDYFYLGLVNFVEEMARVSQGRGRLLLDRRDRQPRLRELRRRAAHEAIRPLMASDGRRPQPSGLSSNSFSRAESSAGRRGSQDSSTRPTSIMSRRCVRSLSRNDVSFIFTSDSRATTRNESVASDSPISGAGNGIGGSDLLAGEDDVDGIAGLGLRVRRGTCRSP